MNKQIENHITQSSKVVGNPEFRKSFIEKVKSGKFNNADYVELFTSNFEVEIAGYASQKAQIEYNSSIKELIVWLIVLQSLFLTLYVRQTRKT